MAIPRVTHWSTMATALSPGRSTVSSQCLCKYDTALAFRAFKHSLKTRKGQKNRDRVERRTREREREKSAYRWKGGVREGWKLLRLVFNLQFVRQCFPRSPRGAIRIKIIFYSRIAPYLYFITLRSKKQLYPRDVCLKENLLEFIYFYSCYAFRPSSLSVRLIANRQQIRPIPIIRPPLSILNFRSKLRTDS